MLGGVAGTIVAGFDGGDASGRALDRAIRDAQAASARVVVVVVEPMPFDPLGLPEEGPWGLGPPQRDEDALRELALDRQTPPALQPLVDEALRRTSDAGVAADILWRVGDPAREIVDVARDEAASSIVVGAHHHRLLGAAFGEDVAGAVRRDARCDVVAVD